MTTTTQVFVLRITPLPERELLQVEVGGLDDLPTEDQQKWLSDSLVASGPLPLRGLEVPQDNDMQLVVDFDLPPSDDEEETEFAVKSAAAIVARHALTWHLGQL